MRALIRQHSLCSEGGALGLSTAGGGGGGRVLQGPHGRTPPPPTHRKGLKLTGPCVTFCRAVVSLRGPGQSPVLRMLRRVAAFCRPLRPVLLLVSFPRSRGPAVGVLGLCWMWRDVAGCGGCAVRAPAAPNSWRIEDVLVVVGVV